MTGTLGADPEFQLYDGESSTRDGYHGRIIPCVGIIKGTKENPYDLGNGYAVHEDNVAVELNIPFVVAGKTRAFSSNIMEGKSRILDLLNNTKPADLPPGLKKRGKPSKRGFETSLPFSLQTTTTATNERIGRASNERYRLMTGGARAFMESDLESKQAQHFGCEPDYDAYTAGKVRHLTNQLDHVKQYRFFAGHLHLGGEFNCPPFVAALVSDVIITIPSLYPVKDTKARVIMTQHNDIRKTWYGKAGIFREKPYGIEYRTLTNDWCGSAQQCEIIAERAFRCIHWLEHTTATKIRTAVADTNWLEVQELIANPPKNITKCREIVGEMINRLSARFPI